MNFLPTGELLDIVNEITHLGRIEDPRNFWFEMSAGAIEKSTVEYQVEAVLEIILNKAIGTIGGLYLRLLLLIMKVHMKGKWLAVF